MRLGSNFIFVVVVFSFVCYNCIWKSQKCLLLCIVYCIAISMDSGGEVGEVVDGVDDGEEEVVAVDVVVEDWENSVVGGVVDDVDVVVVVVADDCGDGGRGGGGEKEESCVVVVVAVVVVVVDDEELGVAVLVAVVAGGVAELVEVVESRIVIPIPSSFVLHYLTAQSCPVQTTSHTLMNMACWH